MRAQLATHLVRLRRFTWVGRIVPEQGHSDGHSAISEDRTRMALLLDGGVWLSKNDGRDFTLVEKLARGSLVTALRFGPTGHWLGYHVSAIAPVRHQQLMFVPTDGGVPSTFALTQGDQLHPPRADGRWLLSRDDRCLYTVDPSAPVAQKLLCLPGPRIDKDHFFYVAISPSARYAYEIQGDFQATRGVVTALDGGARSVLHGKHDLQNAHVGPDDAGRVGWEARYGVLRNEGPDGFRDTPQVGMPLGFDLQGNVLAFVQPPLREKHQTGQRMPPASGVLDDYKCKLLARLPSKDGGAR